MKLLQEIINPNTVNLTDTQQGVLITIKIAPTPEVAYEATNGSEQSVYARNSLRTLGLIKVGGNRAGLTGVGENVVVNYDLVDQTGQLTDRGNAIVADYNSKFHKDSEQNSPNDQTQDINPNPKPNPNDEMMQ